ncbi:MAG: hypothetical protein P1P88_15315 [Bacteroidales bacterium]|nr:hypothetical protein [Bacteroidales bacterium]
MIIKLLARVKKCNLIEYDYEEDKALFFTHLWEDKEKELQIFYDKNLTIPAISIEIEANDRDLFNYFIDFMAEKLNVYAIESLLAINQELVEKNHFLLRIVSLGTYFIKPYPFHINFLISENLFSKKEEIVKSAIVAAGLSGKETFKYELLELLKEQNNEGIIKLINESLKMIEYFKKHKPRFYTLD